MSNHDSDDFAESLKQLLQGEMKCGHQIHLESVMGILASHVLAQGGRIEVDTSPALDHNTKSPLEGLGLMIIPKEGHPGVTIVELRPIAEVEAANAAMAREEDPETDAIDATRYVHPNPGRVQ